MERTEIAEHIRILRMDYFKESQKDFAERLGVNPVSVARFETSRVPKREILKALESLADEAGYKAGIFAFSAAIGPRFEQSKRLDVSEQEDLLDSATMLYGDWNALQGVVDMTSEDAHYLAGRIDSDFRELIGKLRRHLLIGNK